MNILVALSQDEQVNNVLMGWAYAFNTVGHNIITWNGATPLFAVFEQYKPSVFLIGAGSVTKTHQKAIGEFKPATWVFFAKQNELKNKIEEAREIGYLSTAEVEVGQYHSLFGWDTVNFGPQKKEEKYICQYAYVGKFNPKLQKHFVELGDSLRIYSPDIHPYLSYVGTDNNKPAIFASSEFVILGGVDDNIDYDTDFFNAIASGAKVGTRSPDVKTHSYYHRIHSFLSEAYPNDFDDTKQKLFEKMKEIEQ